MTGDARSGFNYHECKLIEKKVVTHDTFLYVFSLPESTKMCVPIGYHVFLKFFRSKIYLFFVILCIWNIFEIINFVSKIFSGPDNYPVKPYTVVSNCMFDDHINEDGKHICLMIKDYSEGFFTSKLRSLKPGSKINISNFTGSFNCDKLLACEDLILVCAGTGFTPMNRLMIKAVDLDNIK